MKLFESGKRIQLNGEHSVLEPLYDRGKHFLFSLRSAVGILLNVDNVGKISKRPCWTQGQEFTASSYDTKERTKNSATDPFGQEENHLQTSYWSNWKPACWGAAAKQMLLFFRSSASLLLLFFNWPGTLKKGSQRWNLQSFSQFLSWLLLTTSQNKQIPVNVMQWITFKSSANIFSVQKNHLAKKNKQKKVP